MKSQKLKTICLGFLLAVATISCGRKDSKDRQSEHNNLNSYEYKTHVKDSIVRANGFPEGSSAFWDKVSTLNDSIKTLEDKNTPLYAMKSAVFDEGKKIAEKYVDILANNLKNYNLTLDRELVKGAFCNQEFIMYGAYKDAGKIGPEYYRYDEWAIDSETERIVKSFNLEKESVKQEIANIIRKTIIQMCNEMYPSRKTIEWQYAKYFAGGMRAINDGSVAYSEGDCWAEYCDWELGNAALVTKQSLWLYDSKLKPEFFKDKTANYIVKQDSDGLWYVEKMGKKGVLLDTTHHFTHNDTDYEIETTPVWDMDSIPHVGKQTFNTASGDNYGVHIFLTEVIDVVKPQSIFRGSSELERQIRKLKAEQRDMNVRLNNLINVENYADSIAEQMTKMWMMQKAK